MKPKNIIVMMLTIIAITSSCSAKTKYQKTHHGTISADSIMHAAMGDSIYTIITQANKINAALMIPQSDSICQVITKKIAAKDISTVKFIVANPKNYLTNATVYGMFMPQFQVTFINKKQRVTLKYDFGLRKWSIYNANEKQILIRDLASDNMLRFACYTFPADTFLQGLLTAQE